MLRIYEAATWLCHGCWSAAALDPVQDRRQAGGGTLLLLDERYACTWHERCTCCTAVYRTFSLAVPLQPMGRRGWPNMKTAIARFARFAPLQVPSPAPHNQAGCSGRPLSRGGGLAPSGAPARFLKLSPCALLAARLPKQDAWSSPAACTLLCFIRLCSCPLVVCRVRQRAVLRGPGDGGGHGAQVNVPTSLLLCGVREVAADRRWRMPWCSGDGV